MFTPEPEEDVAIKIFEKSPFSSVRNKQRVLLFVCSDPFSKLFSQTAWTKTTHFSETYLHGWYIIRNHYAHLNYTWVQCSAWIWNRPFKNQQCWGLVSMHCPSNSPQQGLKTCCTTDCNEDRWLHCVALHWAWPSERTVHSAYKHVQDKPHFSL